MKKISFLFGFLFMVVLLNGQIVDRRQGLDSTTVDGKKVYLILDTIFSQTESGVLRIQTDNIPIDSANLDQTSNRLKSIVQSEVSEAISGLQRAQAMPVALQTFTQVAVFFETLTGIKLQEQFGRDHGGSWEGNYVVTLEDNSTFDAVIEYTVDVDDGNMRLRRTSDDQTWVFIPLNPNGFRLNNFDHDGVGGGEMWIFTKRLGDAALESRPTEWSSLKSTNFAITKVVSP